MDQIPLPALAVFAAVAIFLIGIMLAGVHENSKDTSGTAIFWVPFLGLVYAICSWYLITLVVRGISPG